MKKRKRNLAALTLAALTALTAVMLTGCGSASSSSETAVWSNGAAAGDMREEAGFSDLSDAQPEVSESAEGGNEAQDAGQSLSSDRKLIKKVNMTVETRSFDEALSSIQEQVTALGGYIESMDTYNGSRYSSYSDSLEKRYSSMTARIPRDRLDAFLDTVSEVCNVVSRSDSVEDVTLTYVDLASRKKALETEQERLLELLEQAGSMEDIITVEQRLSDVRYQLESMESKLRTIDDQVDYSTVYLELKEVRELTPAVKETVWERISGGFLSSLRGVGSGLTEFAVWFLSNIPYLLVWAAVIAAAVALVRLLAGRKGKRRSKKGREKEKGDPAGQQGEMKEQ